MMTQAEAQEMFDNSPENAPQIAEGFNYCSTHNCIEQNGACADALGLGEEASIMSKYQPVIVARIPSDIPTEKHADIHVTIARLNGTLKPSYFTAEDAQRAAVYALHGAGITACAYPDAVLVKAAPPCSPGGITYSVVVRNPNTWTQDRNGGNREYEITAHCGHKHKSFGTAQACHARLTAWRDGSTSARWYHARIEDSTGHEAARKAGYSVSKEVPSKLVITDEMLAELGAM